MTISRIALTLFLILGPVAHASMAAESAVRQAPRLLKGSANGVGELVADAKFTDLSGQSHSINKLTSAHRMTVIAMTSTSCPLSKKYLPTLVELSKEYADDVAWVIVNPVKTDDDAAMRSAASRLGDNVLYVHDPAEEFAKHVGALTTTDVIVLDRSQTIVFHGAIDDQHGFGYSVQTPRHRYLADALTAIKASRTPLIVATEAPGCTLRRRTDSAVQNNITYHNRVSRIIQQNCVNCHREGGVAPFTLTTLEDVQSHAGMIEQVVERGLMPPWFAANTIAGKTLAGSTPANDAEVLSPWINDCSLGESEKRDLLTWLAGEMPAGDADDAPLPLTFASDWEIGTPDAVFQFAQPQEIKATGVMPYQNVEVQTDLDDDKWVQAIEVKPGNRSVVHHVLVFVQVEGKEHRERDGFWGIYVPGNSSLIYPDGFAKRLPKGAKLQFQMHYTPNGTATTDRTSIGIVYAKHPPQHEVQVTGIFNSKIRIPAGAENHSEVASLPIPAAARVLGFLPHMHLRGKAARYELVRSSGDTETLLDVPNYDFNWQLLYRYRDPLLVERGDTIRFTSWYDNSANNPANPDPTTTVRWGSQTYDEMQVGYVEYYVPNEIPREMEPVSPDLNNQSSNRHAKLFRRLDTNQDGVITRAEVRERMPGDQKAAGPIFDRLDANQDDEITPAELAKL
jgi:thiol-disulfide isomerase/thioredoxin/Ca2+-binding EF-hand superfamily protein